MKKIPKAIYKPAEELRDEIEKRETAISLLDDGELKQKLRHTPRRLLPSGY